MMNGSSVGARIRDSCEGSSALEPASSWIYVRNQAEHMGLALAAFRRGITALALYTAARGMF